MCLAIRTYVCTLMQISMNVPFQLIPFAKNMLIATTWREALSVSVMRVTLEMVSSAMVRCPIITEGCLLELYAGYNPHTTLVDTVNPLV